MSDVRSIERARPTLDRLADAAARRPVAPPRDPDAIVREALIVGRARARAARSRRAVVIGAGLAIAAAIPLAVALRWVTPGAPVAAPLEVAVPARAEPAAPIALALGGRHRIEALAGTALLLGGHAADHALALGDEAVRIDDGAALFDVSPLAPGASFVVVTPDARVRVIGTVFSVRVARGRTRVDVFEGRVEVQDARGTRVLGAGERYATDPDLDVDAVLASHGRAAADARAASRPVASVASAPASASASASAPAPAPAPAPTSASASASASAPAPASASAPAPAPLDLPAVRELCDRGEFEVALAAIARATPSRAEQGEWAMVEGDAQRALAHLDEAADAYERAADALSPSRAALAGFLAAQVHLRRDDPARALAVIERTGAAAPGSPVEERALATRATLLVRAGRDADARIAARTYLASFPGGEAVGRMEALLAE